MSDHRRPTPTHVRATYVAIATLCTLILSLGSALGSGTTTLHSAVFAYSLGAMIVCSVATLTVSSLAIRLLNKHVAHTKANRERSFIAPIEYRELLEREGRCVFLGLLDPGWADGLARYHLQDGFGLDTTLGYEVHVQITRDGIVQLAHHRRYTQELSI